MDPRASQWNPAQYKTATGDRARVLVRDYDGQVRALERRAPSRTPAERALKVALRDRTPAQARGELTADSRVTALAEAWYAGLATSPPSRCRPTATASTAHSPASASSASASQHRHVPRQAAGRSSVEGRPGSADGGPTAQGPFRISPDTVP